jgi:hypothetical protein
MEQSKSETLDRNSSETKFVHGKKEQSGCSLQINKVDAASSRKATKIFGNALNWGVFDDFVIFLNSKQDITQWINTDKRARKDSKVKRTDH